MNRINKDSLDLTKENIQKIKELFPNVVTDGKINFDILRNLIGDEIENSSDKYQFNWFGKSNTIKFSQTPSTGTLIPCLNKGTNWENTQNMYIEGDNLEVLKLLQKTYFGKIKMIYIDPPYNTGNDFVYNDNFKDSITNYKEITGQKCRANAETSGRFHTDWLNMMYSRLLIAKNLLKEDGLIFISIDDNEYCNLKKICDEIYSESCYIATLVWQKRTGGGFSNAQLSVNHEYILLYSKSDKTKIIDLLVDDVDINKIYNYKDEISKYKRRDLRKSGTADRRIDRPTMYYEIVAPDGTSIYPKKANGEDGRWTYSKEKFELEKQNNNIEFIKNDNEWKVYYKERYIESSGKTQKHESLLLNLVTNTHGSKEIENLFGDKNYFSFPKPTELILYLMRMALEEEDIVLDFFSGSATTAHSLFRLNAEDGKNRKFIMVQLPELCEENSEAYKNGYINICEIGEERIRRAGAKIYNELKQKYDNAGLLKNDCVNPDELDFGFKVFRLESTNIKPWDGTVEIEENTLFDLTETIKEGRTNLDVAYEIMLKYGIFNMPLKETLINSKTMYNVGEGYMIICLDNHITLDDVTEIAKRKPHCVVFKEQGFADDNVKMNATYTLERLGVEDIKCI